MSTWNWKLYIHATKKVDTTAKQKKQPTFNSPYTVSPEGSFHSHWHRSCIRQRQAQIALSGAQLISLGTDQQILQVIMRPSSGIGAHGFIAQQNRCLMVLNSVSGRQLKGQRDACSETERHTQDKGADYGNNNRHLNFSALCHCTFILQFVCIGLLTKWCNRSDVFILQQIIA